MKKQLVVFIAIVLLAVAGARGMLQLKKAPEQKHHERPIPSVAVQTVSKQPVTLEINTQGTVQPLRRIQLVSEVSGRVLWVSEQFVSGNLVSANTELLRIDPTDYEVIVAEAQSALLSARLDYSDKKARYQNESLSVQQSQAQLQTAEKRLAQAKQDLANTSLKAPFPAIVINRSADLGQFVTAGTPVMELLSTDIAELRLPIKPKDISLLSQQPFGMAANINNAVILRAALGTEQREWQAQLSRIEGQVDNKTRVYYAVVTVKDPYALETDERAALPIGTYVNASIAARPIEGAVILPDKALQNDDSVFIIGPDNTLIKRPVNVVHIASEQAVINDGLNDGDQVVTTPLAQMFEGMQVTIAIPADNNTDIAEQQPLDNTHAN